MTINLLLSRYLVYTTGPVHGRVYTAVPCTGPCRRPVTYTAVYTIVYMTVQMDEYTAVYGRCNGHETSGHAVTV